MKSVSVLFGAAVMLLAISSGAASQTASVPASGAIVDLGSFSAGTYQLVGSGLIDSSGVGTVIFRPDGTPDFPLTDPTYSYFNPSGAFTDVLLGNATGRAGFNAKIGALVGTLNPSAFSGNNPTPAQANDWFLIGYGTTITLAATQHIYASVNDTYYINNFGEFSVSVTAVPEPTSSLMFLIGVGVLLGNRRLRARVVAT